MRRHGLAPEGARYVDCAFKLFMNHDAQFTSISGAGTSEKLKIADWKQVGSQAPRTFAWKASRPGSQLRANAVRLFALQAVIDSHCSM
jgi:hypothetical protein